MQIPPHFFYGLSGVELPIPKYKFPLEYQKASRLTYYSTFFNSLEVNSSFYKIPMNATVMRWALSVSEGFRFTFKLFKEITHVKNLHFDTSHIQHYINTVCHIGIKKGCLLVQFPPSLSNENIGQLDHLLRSIELIDHNHVWHVAVEFRNKSWYNEDTYDLLKSHDASLVMHDIPKSATPFFNISSNTIYIRFHGPTGNYRGSYSDAFLMEYADYIKSWLSERRVVYLYFNNTAGDAFNNLITLKKFLDLR